MSGLVDENTNVSPNCPSPPAAPAAPAYYSINPALFDSKEYWSYRDLQRLCKRLNLNASGRRERLVEALQEWHRESRRLDQSGKFLDVEAVAQASMSRPPAPPLTPRSPPRSPPGARLAWRPRDQPAAGLAAEAGAAAVHRGDTLALHPFGGPPRPRPLPKAVAEARLFALQPGQAHSAKGADRDVRSVQRARLR